MQKPTFEQAGEFWEWCGLRKSGYWWFTPNGRHLTSTVPIIDLNNLFKYAVPKLVELGYYITIQTIIYTRAKGRGYDVEIHDKNKEMVSWIDDKDPALALFWALWGIKKG